MKAIKQIDLYLSKLCSLQVLFITAKVKSCYHFNALRSSTSRDHGFAARANVRQEKPIVTCSKQGSAKSPKPKGTMDVLERLDLRTSDGKRNEMLYRGTPSKASETVIFFGGDVQDFKENMESHRDNKRYTDWSLERTASLLRSHFLAADVWIIKPTSMHLRTFSVYSNFVDSSQFGNPTHNEDYGGLRYLKELLDAGIKDISEKDYSAVCENSVMPTGKQSCTRSEITKTSLGSSEGQIEVTRTALPISIIGFSKGCVVLNQFLYEFNQAKQERETADFFNRIKNMYWLDGGHSGGSNTWVTEESVLKGLVDTDINIHVHVTPYQVRDTSRAWIGKEQKKFVEKLKKLKVSVIDKIHFEDKPRSIENHFNVLNAFKEKAQ